MIYFGIVAASAVAFALGGDSQRTNPSEAAAGASHRCSAPRPAIPSGVALDRLNEIQSDSLWLKKRLLARYPERIAAIFHAPIDGDSTRLKMVVRVKGDAPLPPMKLGDRAKDVPVVVEYGATHSLRDIEAVRIRLDHTLAGVLPTLNGTAYDERAGALWLDIYAPDAAAEAAALTRCSEIERLYGMPVQMAFSKGRISLQDS